MKTKLIFTALLLAIALTNAKGQTVSGENSIKDSIPRFEIPQEVPADISVIKPPVGFDTSSYFTGYINYKSRSAIIIHEIQNSNVQNIEAGITDEYFSSNGLTLVERKNFKSTDENEGVYFKSRFLNKEVAFIRIMVYMGSNNHLLVLDIVYPEELIEELEERILNSLTSINFKR